MTTTADLIARAEAAQDWMRRPDNEEMALEDFAEWLNNRPCSVIPRMIAALRDEKARADAAEAERDELATAIDGIETSHGVTGNGNLWRWWRERARDALGKRDAKLARAEAADAKLAEAVEALDRISKRKDYMLPSAAEIARATLAKIGATK